MKSLVSMLNSLELHVSNFSVKLVDAIAYPQSTDPDQACVGPQTGMESPLLQESSHHCRQATVCVSGQHLTGGDDSSAWPAASPGYVMQALPEQLTTSHLPSRLPFCRPRFC